MNWANIWMSLFGTTTLPFRVVQKREFLFSGLMRKRVAFVRFMECRVVFWKRILYNKCKCMKEEEK